MPGATDRVVIDLEKFRRLIADMQQARDAIWESARVIRAALDDVGLFTGRAARLKAVGDWADDQVTMLRHRLLIAEATDGTSDGGDQSTTDQLAGHRSTVRQPSRIVTLRSAPDRHPTSGQAYAAGSVLAERFVGLPPDGVRASTDDFAVLQRHATDLDFVEGFYDALGPANLAQVVYQVEGLTPHPQACPPGAEPELADPELDRASAAAALGASLASYTRIHPVDEIWLGSFNTRGLEQTMESALLIPLLPHGRFDPDLLRRLGDQYYGAHSEVDDVGLFAGDHPAAVTRSKYEAALLRAIADSPGLASGFAMTRVEEFVDQSHLRVHDALFRDMIPDEVEQARTHLIRTALGPDPSGRSADVRVDNAPAPT